MSPALRKLLTTLVLTLAAHSALAFDWTAWWPTAGSGQVVTQVYEVPAFDSLQLATNAEVEVQPGAHRTVTIESDDNLMRYFDVYVVQRVLVVQDKHAFRATRARLRVASPSLVGITTTGNTRLQGHQLASRELRLSANGHSRITLDGLACEALRVEAGDAAQLRLDGAANELAVTLAGESGLAADRLQARRVQIGAANAAQARLNVQERLAATVSDTASVRYYGSPQVTAHATEPASVQPLRPDPLPAASPVPARR